MTDTQEKALPYVPSEHRTHMAALVKELPTELWLEFQDVARDVPEVQKAVEQNGSFRTVRALIDGGHGELGRAVATLVQADLRQRPASV